MDLAKLARDCGATPYTNRHYPDRTFYTFSPEQLEMFAAAILAHERELLSRCPSMLEWIPAAERMPLPLPFNAEVTGGPLAARPVD